nr:unnamed protein product [Digitaria exilis]
MASAQAPSSSAPAPSRKEHLEAGKKRLEQFRKKKAAKKATAVAASTEQAKPPAPDAVDNPSRITSTASSGDGLVSDVGQNQASTSSVPSAVYESGLAVSSKGAESLSNGLVSANSNIRLQQDAVSDGGSKFYGNLSFSDLVNGHHENWRGDAAQKGDEHSPDKDVQPTSKLSSSGNTNSLGLSSSIDTLPSWGRNSLFSQVRDTEQSSSYSPSTFFGNSENTYTQDYSTNNDIFGRFRATSKESSQAEQSMYASSQDYGSTFNSSKLLWFGCQLIEDLTMEKFSLQRSLQKSQELAETLATDNSALTDKFNQQAHVISQLTSDMERLQEEIQAQLLALESVRTEYANAQLECSAADERAKVLAAEVILLEDKALKLRSSELKLEKEVEGLHSEISSYRRKVSSLEKERQHLQSTVEALQEGMSLKKKLLYSKLRNIPVNEKATTAIEKPSADKRDASTATEDLDTGETSSSETLTSTVDTLDDAGTSVLRSNNVSDFPSLEEVSSSIPDDQLRMIDNINSLMSELAVEREELLRALRIESSNCSKLKELNKDLTQKLETQTQRLELLTSRRMANESVLTKPIDTRSINDATMYADEGDEFVLSP